MRNDRPQRSISSLAALLMLLVFAVALLAVLLHGAGVYERLTLRDRHSYDSRTCVQYLTTKLRQAESPDAVTLSQFGDGDSLTITETINGTAFCTQVYCCDGYLRELFTAANAGLAPEAGEKVLPAHALQITAEDALLFITVVDGNGITSELTVCLRGTEEVAP